MDTHPADATQTGLATARSSTRRTAERAFSISVLVSGIRCTLTYVVLPFVMPVVGLAPGVGPTLGIAIGVVAIIANIVSIRRFWRVQHPRRRLVTAIHLTVITLLVVLLTTDIGQLLSPPA